jgi:hypothetical protein
MRPVGHAADQTVLELTRNGAIRFAIAPYDYRIGASARDIE